MSIFETIFITTVDILAITNKIKSISFPLAEVLLDMKSSGGELGWLTSPYDEGVSISSYYS